MPLYYLRPFSKRGNILLPAAADAYAQALGNRSTQVTAFFDTGDMIIASSMIGMEKAPVALQIS